MNPCEHCEMVDYCKELGRCFFTEIDNTEEEGELTELDEVNEPELKQRKQVKAPDKLTKAHRDFLKDVLNF